MTSNLSLNKPLMLALLVAIIPYGLVVYTHYIITDYILFQFSMNYIVYMVAGYFYMHFFEWYFHHGPMHHKMKIWPRAILKSHMAHHRVFVDDNFKSRDPADLDNITTAHHIFPILFSLHYLIFILFLPNQFAPVFFLGVLIHFLIYEITHWFTHLNDNLFDKIILSIPIFGHIRERQIMHHYTHHQEPAWDFAFNPPYLFDFIFRTKK